MKTITAKKMVQFWYMNIICQYGISYKIVSNNGLQFDYLEFGKFCDDLGINK